MKTPALISLMLMMLAAPLAGRAQVTVRAELDSATLLMGKVTALNVTLTKPASMPGQLVIPPDSMARDVEIAALPAGDTTDLGNGVEEIKRRIMLQAFDSGVYMLRPVLFVGAKGDTLAESGRAVLKVIPANVDSLKTIHDYADVQDPGRRWTDYLPDFLTDWGIWALVGLAVAVAAWVLWRRWRAGRPLLKKAETRQLPPYEEAVTALNRLRERHLCEKGMEKEYYTDLTEILRIYLERRFGINAMEMTSSQILQALEHNDDTRLPKRYMSQILQVADFVKFAAQRPLPDDNAKAFSSAMQFVEDTKPQPAPDAADSKGAAPKPN